MDFIFSENNIVSAIPETNNFVIANLLKSTAHIVSAQELESIKQSANSNTPHENYVTNSGAENEEFNKKYLKHIYDSVKDEIQIFFVPNYSCNFACSYCYQDEYTPGVSNLNNEIIDSFFTYINHAFQGRSKYITLFGGEPLLAGEKHKELIQYFITSCKKNDLSLAVVTNGFELENYIEILKLAHIREIQITLDGTEQVHNKRRFLHGGGETFHKIVSGIDACLAAELPVNLRFVIDKENIDNLPELARFAINKNWTSNPLFKTQIGRNYELHHCQENHIRLFTRLELSQALYELIQKFPHILEFHKPAFSIARYLMENGELPEPLFDSCPACKSEWAFDYTGSIYSCTATVGKASEKLGSFYPIVELNNGLVNTWQKRDVVTIPECKSCSIKLVCGGGCASVAKNANGKILSPDCRPAGELLGLGVDLYTKFPIEKISMEHLIK